MRIAVIGSGYVGLVTGACLADLGNQVVCVDHDEQKIALLRDGVMPIHEPGLEPLVHANVNEGRLSFTTSIPEGIRGAEIVFICVGTPPLPTGEANLTYVENAIKTIAASADDGYKLIVEKSTVPVRTSEWLNRMAREVLHPQGEFDIACNPEFLSEGTALHDFMHPNRIIIGTNTDRAAMLLTKLYSPLNAPILLTDINSAELIKHASNAFLAMRISFINAVAQVCEATGADVEKVAKGIGLDNRIGTSFLQAGAGYGGTCFPKDIAAFIRIADKMGIDFQLLKAVRDINDQQRQLLVDKAIMALNGEVSGKIVGVLGLSFKPNTDDMRGAPSITIIQALQERGAVVRAYDPVAIAKARPLLPGVQFTDSLYDVAFKADAIVIMTEWDQFKYMDLPRLKQMMARPIIIDGRNLYDPGKMQAMGFRYYSVGRTAPAQPVSLGAFTP